MGSAPLGLTYPRGAVLLPSGEHSPPDLLPPAFLEHFPWQILYISEIEQI